MISPQDREICSVDFFSYRGSAIGKELFVVRLEIKFREDGKIILGKKSVNKCLIICTNHRNCAIINSADLIFSM
jgi:hypothetical protein